MAGCEKVQTLFKDWIFGELPAADAGEVERHVRECPECAAVVEPYLRVYGALAEHLSVERLPAHLVFLGDARRQANFWASLWRTAALSAAAAVVFVAIAAGGYFGSGLLTPRPAPPPTLASGEAKALIRQEVKQVVAEQETELAAENQRLAANLREELQHNFTSLGQRIEYLDKTQRVLWRDSQERNAVLELVARSALLEQQQR